MFILGFNVNNVVHQQLTALLNLLLAKCAHRFLVVSCDVFHCLVLSAGEEDI